MGNQRYLTVSSGSWSCLKNMFCRSCIKEQKCSLLSFLFRGIYGRISDKRQCFLGKTLRATSVDHVVTLRTKMVPRSRIKYPDFSELREEKVIEVKYLQPTFGLFKAPVHDWDLTILILPMYEIYQQVGSG